MRKLLGWAGTALMVLVAIVATVSGRIVGRAAVETVAGPSHQTAHVSSQPTAAVQSPVAPAWTAAATVFEQDHPDLRVGRNYQLMQQALDGQPAGLSDAEVLSRAYMLARQSPSWDKRPVPPPGFAYEN